MRLRKISKDFKIRKASLNILALGTITPLVTALIINLKTARKDIWRQPVSGMINGRWTFVKRGENFGIKLVEKLPGIHNRIMEEAAKDIFRG